MSTISYKLIKQTRCTIIDTRLAVNKHFASIGEIQDAVIGKRQQKQQDLLICTVRDSV